MFHSHANAPLPDDLGTGDPIAVAVTNLASPATTDIDPECYVESIGPSHST